LSRTTPCFEFLHGCGLGVACVGTEKERLIVDRADALAQKSNLADLLRTELERAERMIACGSEKYANARKKNVFRRLRYSLRLAFKGKPVATSRYCRIRNSVFFRQEFLFGRQLRRESLRARSGRPLFAAGRHGRTRPWTVIFGGRVSGSVSGCCRKDPMRARALRVARPRRMQAVAWEWRSVRSARNDSAGYMQFQGYRDCAELQLR
jgi:hypothetical protein